MNTHFVQPTKDITNCSPELISRKKGGKRKFRGKRYPYRKNPLSILFGSKTRTTTKRHKKKKKKTKKKKKKTKKKKKKTRKKKGGKEKDSVQQKLEKEKRVEMRKYKLPVVRGEEEERLAEEEYERNRLKRHYGFWSGMYALDKWSDEPCCNMCEPHGCMSFLGCGLNKCNQCDSEFQPINEIKRHCTPPDEI